jgi:hypothetical protein
MTSSSTRQMADDVYSMGSHHLRSANLIATPVECQNCGNCANRRRGLPSSMPALPTRPGGLLDPGPHASLRCMDGQQRRTRLASHQTSTKYKYRPAMFAVRTLADPLAFMLQLDSHHSQLQRRIYKVETNLKR